MTMFSELKKYVTGNIPSDCITLLQKYDNEIVEKHTISVAEKAKELGNLFGLDTHVLTTAAYLHDISVVIPRDKYAQICKKHSIEVIELEQKLPILLHQRVSKIITEGIFNVRDKRILSPISCHTTLKCNPSKYDMVLQAKVGSRRRATV